MKDTYQTRATSLIYESATDSQATRFGYSAVVATAVVAYVLFASLLLTVMIKTASSDSAEQLVWAQDWRLGYGIQPPLYSWVQLIFFKIFGVNLAAVVFLKEILIGISAWLAYLSVLRMIKDHKLAALACASLLLMPEFAYESHRNLSHSLLTMALVAATLYLMVRIATAPEIIPRLYCALGLVVGAGLLSKYNFGIFFVAGCAAALSMPELRRIALNRWMLISCCLALLIFAPHAVWLSHHFHEGLSDKMAVKLHPEAERAWLPSITGGTWALFGMFCIMFALPLLGTYAAALLIWRKKQAPTPVGGELWLRFLTRLLACEGLAMAVLILLFRVTGFQSRWLLPWLFVLPMYAVLLWRERITPAVRHFVLTLSIASGMAALLIFGFGNQIAGLTGHYHGADIPFEQLAAKIQSSGFRAGTVVSDEHWYVGNLRLYFPESVFSTTSFQGPPAPRGEPLLIVWSGTEMPAGLKTFVEQRWPHLLEKFMTKSVELKYRDSGVSVGKFGYVLADTGNR